MLKKTNEKPSALDEAIERVLASMQNVETDSEEYGTLIGRLDKLHAMKIAEKDNRHRVSADTMLTVGANILGILMILGHERVNVVTSKALSFIVKPKI